MASSENLALCSSLSRRAYLGEFLGIATWITTDCRTLEMNEGNRYFFHLRSSDAVGRNVDIGAAAPLSLQQTAFSRASLARAHKS
jgi:hypothetical protein